MTDRHERAFLSFDEANPKVYELFKHFALQAAYRGARVGAKAIWERIRWEFKVSTTEKPYRLNNNHTAFMARKFIREFPQHADLFETRQRATEREEGPIAELAASGVESQEGLF